MLRTDAFAVNEDMDTTDELGSALIWASPTVPTGLEHVVATRSLDDVLVGAVALHAPRGRVDHPAPCDERGRTAAGAGYWTGPSEPDLCLSCFEPVRDEPARAPTPAEQVCFARAGIDTGGSPVRLALTDDVEAQLATLARLVAEHDIARVVLVRTPALCARLAAAAELPPRMVLAPVTGMYGGLTGSIDLRAYELQLRGLAFGPPMNPDLVARMAAASDERGVIHDASLADEYFEAMQAQSAALNELLGRPEPVIEQGRAFPSLDEDAPPLD